RAFEQSLKRFRPLIAQALAETGPAGFAALLKLADHEDPAIRLVVVRSLAAKKTWSAEREAQSAERDGQSAARSALPAPRSPTTPDPFFAPLLRWLRD